MLVGKRIFQHRVDMDTPFVGEGASSDEGPGIERWDVGDLAHIQREMRQLFHGFFRDAPPVHLELEVGDDRDEVGVTAALAVSVDGPLDHLNALFDGGDRVGHGESAVIMGMDSQTVR